ncbi:MAG: helix-turn-helix domain-containing protein [Anaerovoracaceae bacterium]
MLYEKTEYLDDFPININIVRIKEYPVHYHLDVEFVYVLDGEVKLRNGYCDYILRRGDIFTNSGHEVHNLEATDSDNVVALIQVSNLFFTQYFPTLNNACFRTYTTRDTHSKLDRLRKMLLNILLDYSRRSFNYKHTCIDMMIEVIKYMDENFNLFSFEDQVVVNFKSNNRVIAERISHVINYIYENHASHITLQDLADIEHLSTFYLSHLIRDYVGISFQELLCFARVEMSEINLLGTDKKISTVARDSGFSTTAYYEKFFQQWFHHSPQEHRNMFHNKILSEDFLPNIYFPSTNEIVNLLRRRLSSLASQDNNPSTINRMQLSIQVEKCKQPIMELHHALDVIITTADYRIMGNRMFAYLEELHPALVSISVNDHSTNDKKMARELSCILNKAGYATRLIPQATLVLQPSYGYDSIAAAAYIFKECFLSKDAYLPCRLRDQGSPEIVLQGTPACLTASMMRKPSYYAYYILSILDGNLLYWSRSHWVIQSKDRNGRSMYILAALNFNDEIPRLCTRDASIYEVNDVLNRYNDEISISFNLPVPNGKYTIVKYALGTENTIFNYMSQLGLNEESKFPDAWGKLLHTNFNSYAMIDEAKDGLDVSFDLQGAGIQLAIIQNCEEVK